MKECEGILKAKHMGQIRLILFQANAWVQLSPTGSIPGAREAHAAAFDSTNSRIWIFGGYGSGRLLSVVQDAHFLATCP